MNYGQIRKYDVSNGPGIRVSIFVTGCNFNCNGCFNKEYQDFNCGYLWEDKQTKEVIEYLKHEYIDGLTILGGEPFEHATTMKNIILDIKKYINKSIWIYSGYTFEKILIDYDKFRLLKLCDYIVDGLFEIDKRDLRLKFRGSSNQRIINIKESIEKNKIILWEE